MSWFKTGTVQVFAGSKNLVFTGASLIANKAAIAGMGIQIQGSDKTIELATVDSDSTATMESNWPGSDASGLTFKIVPIQGFQVDLAYTLAQQATQIASWTTLAAGAVLYSYIQFLGGTPVPTARTPVQVATDLSNNHSEVTVASATNTNIGAAASPQVEISGTTTIASLNPSSGTMYQNAIRYVRFSGAGLTLTNGGTLVLPGAANIATAAGDWAIFKSDGSTTPVWRCVSYNRASGRMVSMDSPTFTGTMTAAAASFSGNVTMSGALIYGAGNDYIYLASAHRIDTVINNASILQVVATGISVTGTLSSSGAAATNVVSFSATGTTTGSNAWQIQNGTGRAYFGVESSAGSTIFSGSTAYATVIGSYSNTPVQLWTNGALAVQIGTDQSFLVGTQTNGGWFGGAKCEIRSAVDVLSVYCTASSGSGAAIYSRVNNTGWQLASFYYSTANVGSITVSGGGTATAYNTTSDARLKNVLSDQVDYRAAIRSLWVGDFEWKANGTRAFGVLAQQAHGVMPYGLGVTKPANDADQWHASSEPFGHLALWGVKDLYVMVEGFQVVVDNHEGRIAALEAEVAALKARAA